LDKINEVINANCTLPLLAILKISGKSYIISKHNHLNYIMLDYVSGLTVAAN